MVRTLRPGRRCRAGDRPRLDPAAPARRLCPWTSHNCPPHGIGDTPRCGIAARRGRPAPHPLAFLPPPAGPHARGPKSRNLPPGDRCRRPRSRPLCTSGSFRHPRPRVSSPAPAAPGSHRSAPRRRLRRCPLPVQLASANRPFRDTARPSHPVGTPIPVAPLSSSEPASSLPAVENGSPLRSARPRPLAPRSRLARAGSPRSDLRAPVPTLRSCAPRERGPTSPHPSQPPGPAPPIARRPRSRCSLPIERWGAKRVVGDFPSARRTARGGEPPPRSGSGVVRMPGVRRVGPLLGTARPSRLTPGLPRPFCAHPRETSPPDPIVPPEPGRSARSGPARS